MVLPITMKKFWFVNSYLAVYLLSPFINQMIRSISRKQFHALVTILVALFSLRVTILPITWAQDSTGGMGVLWLGTLYVIGAWLRMTDWKLKNNAWHSLIYLSMSLVLVGVKGILIHMGIPEGYSGKLYGYPSVVVLIESVSLFLYFANRPSIPEKIGKTICAVARHSFAVYIIHFAMVGTLFTEVTHLDSLHSNVIIFVPAMLGVCAACFMLCVLIDAMRMKLPSRKLPMTIEHLISRADELVNGMIG